MWAGALGLAVLVATGIALKDRILEEYWLSELDHGGDEARRAAVERLGLMRSERAAPLVVEEMRRRVSNNRFSLTSFTDDSEEAFLERSIVCIGGACDLHLIDAAMDQNWSVSSLAATCLEEIHGYAVAEYGMPRHEILLSGPEMKVYRNVKPVLRDVKPVLQALADDAGADPEVRRAAGNALKKIKGEEP